MVGPDEALSLVLKNASPLGSERVSILGALGRVLAEQVRSPRDIPGFDNSAMDGYALRAADVATASEANPVRLRVVETIAAGAMPSVSVGPGQAARIMTGAPIPAGADSVIPVERTDGGNGEVAVLSPVERGSCVRPRGEDIRAGESALEPGKVLRPADLGMLAALNRAMVSVCRQPRVAIVCTGDELVDVDQVPTGGQVVNSSGYALAGAVTEAGGIPVLMPIVRDKPEEIRALLTEAAAFDAIFTTGGVSVGQFDHVKRVLDELGMAQVFHGIRQRPGRPLKFGLLNGRPLFGFPGNPVSTVLCFYLYARPALLKMGGRSALGLARRAARCAVDIKTAREMTEFVRVRLEPRDGELFVRPTGDQGSGILSSFSRADALLIGPALETTLRAGTQATVLLLAPEATGDCEAFFEERLRQNH